MSQQYTPSAPSAQTKLDSALALARRGYRVFPLPVDDPAIPPSELKQPHMKKWQLLATANKKQIREWWSEADYNIGLAAGQGVIVLDYDMKPGQDGQRALDTHDMLGLDLTGMSVTTATGGRHFFFRTSAQIRNSASKIAKNVDVRGDGGYVVAPGSTIHGVPYTCTNLTDAAALPELPAWMAKLATAKKTAAADRNENLGGDWDRKENIERAIDYLKNGAPQAFQGSGGDETTYKVACEVRSFKVSQPECLELMLEHWNEQKAEPPWPADELAQKIANAYKYATLPAGTSDAAGEFGPLPVEDVAAALSDHGPERPSIARGLYFVGFKAGAEQALSAFGTPLVKGWLDCGSFSAIYGATNSGKTFVALDLAFHIAAGRPWQGRKVKQGLVVYVAAEGGRGIFKRIAALRLHHGVDDMPLAVVPCPINLLDKSKEGDTRALIKLVREAEAAYGMEAAFVVIDTLSRALAGGDENGPTDMGTFVAHVDRIRAATKAHLCVIHHTGHGEAHRMRGWSGIPAALDAEFEVQAAEKNGMHGQFVNRKQRDREKTETLNFRLKAIEIGTDEDGDAVTSAVAIITQAPEFEVELTPAEKSTLKHLTELAHLAATKQPEAGPADVILRTGDIVAHVQKAARDGQTITPNRTTINNILTALDEKGAIKKDKQGHWLVENVRDV